MAETRVASWECRRGRQDELEKTGTGTATILIHDVDGTYDPSNLSSPYFGQLDGAPVALSLRNPVTDTWHKRFQGSVDEYIYDMTASRQNVVNVTVNCVDAFDYLAGAEMDPLTHGVSSGLDVDAGAVDWAEAEVDERIHALLTQAGWPLDRRKIFTGNVVVQQSIYDGGYSFLAAIQDAVDAEWPGLANLYVDADGDVVFHGRKARFDPVTVANGANWVFTRWKVGDGAAITGDSEYAQLRPPLHSDRSLKLVYNSAQIYPSHVPYRYTEEEYQQLLPTNVVKDTVSIDRYGLRNFPATEVRTLEHKTNGNEEWEETLAMAQYYVDNYSVPRTRPRQVVVKSVYPTDSRAEATWAFLCGVEISDIIRLTVDYPGDGGIDDDFYVEGITTVVRPLQVASDSSGGFDYVEVTCDVSPFLYWGDTGALPGPGDQ